MDTQPITHRGRPKAQESPPIPIPRKRGPAVENQFPALASKDAVIGLSPSGTDRHGLSTGLSFQARDPDFIRLVLPLFAFWVEQYHQIAVSGLERIPGGRALLVGNHNGGLVGPDMHAIMLAYWRTFGVTAPAFGLMHDLVFHVPIVADIMQKLGAVAASPENALALLEGDAKVLVYPGGDMDAFRPASQKNRIVFGDRCGFVRMALRTQSPIVPIVSVGAHDTFFVLSDGVEFARRSGLKQLTRLEVLPLILGLPWGLCMGPLPHWPLPVRARMRVLEPITWPALARDAWKCETVVRRCQQDVVERMQVAMDEMNREGGTGFRGFDFLRSLPAQLVALSTRLINALDQKKGDPLQGRFARSEVGRRSPWIR